MTQKISFVWVAMVLLVWAGTKFQHRLTDLHLSKLIMMVQTIRDVSKFASVNPAEVDLPECEIFYGFYEYQ